MLECLGHEAAVVILPKVASGSDGAIRIPRSRMGTRAAMHFGLSRAVCSRLLSTVSRFRFRHESPTALAMSGALSQWQQLIERTTRPGFKRETSLTEPDLSD